MSTLFDADAPSLSVTVTVTVRYAGYPWSGAMNEPLVTSLIVCHGWRWQSPASEQWCSSTFQLNADAGIVPSSRSVAVAANGTDSPTCQVVAVVGWVSVIVGGELPGVTTTVVVSVPPRESVTMRPTVTVPDCV